VPLALLVTAGLLAVDPWPYRDPVAPAEPVPAWVVDTSTVRNPLLRPETNVAGYTYLCSDCHRLFPSPGETFRELTEHRHVKLEHGLNTRCFNCHHPTDRDAFVDDFGQPIPYDHPERLCAKCHGPVYRDWTHGSHGRTNGYWDESRGVMERTKCIECHDPHQPPFPPMRPAPSPNTLRMGNQTFADLPHEDVKNPLLIYRRSDDSRPEDEAATKREAEGGSR